MRQGFATTWSTMEIESGAKALGAIVALFAGAWALLARCWRRRRAVRAMRALESKAIRYLLDAMHHNLHALAPTCPGDARHIDIDELVRQKHLIADVRDELWVSDGNTSARTVRMVEAEIVKVLTRTQAIAAKRERKQDMFADEETTE
jgi:hypothetical protein